MAFEYKDGTFSLFKNDKGGNDKRPDYRGEGKDLDGNEIEVAAWLRDGPKGKYMSCKFQIKEERREEPKPTPKPNPRDLSDIASDNPFN